METVTLILIPDSHLFCYGRLAYDMQMCVIWAVSEHA